MCMQGCTTVIIASPPFRLNLFNCSVADAARVTCANVTPAGPDRLTMCARGTLHCYASFSILRGSLLINKPDRNTSYVPQWTKGLVDCICASTATGPFQVSFFGSWLLWQLNFSLWVMRRGTNGAPSLPEMSSLERWQWWSAGKLKCSVFQSRPKEKPRWRGASGKQRQGGCTATRRDISILNILFSRIKRKEMVGIIVCLYWLKRVCVSLKTETDTVF